MALIKCPECEKEISDSAAACPGCGRPVRSETRATTDSAEVAAYIKRQRKIGTIWLLAAAVAIGIGLAKCSNDRNSGSAAFSTKSQEEDIIYSCARKAGIPASAPTHAITPVEMAALTACVDRRMKYR